MEEKLLNLKETAQRLAVSPSTLRWWIHTKRFPLPYMKLHNGRIRLKEKDLKDYLKFIERRPARP